MARSRRPSRIVAIGDLNAADDALEGILRGTRLIDAKGRWRGGRARLVQVGDIFNRGAGGRAAFARLETLRRQARKAGGDVIVLLGNHEAMMALRDESHSNETEYLAFATKAQREAWPKRVRRAMKRFRFEADSRGRIEPLAPKLQAWRVANVPGRAALRRAFSKTGSLGRRVRALPVVAQLEHTVFVHGGLTPEWAALGVAGLNRKLKDEWRSAPAAYGKLPSDWALRDGEGPLWSRQLARGDEADVRAELEAVLDALDARRLVIGHTPTRAIPGGRPGRISLRAGGRLACIDVGLREGDPGLHAALIIEGRRGFEWTREGKRPLWSD